ncbi:hypothetical protein WJX74_004590 [Apatococcus lobatus]
MWEQGMLNFQPQGDSDVNTWRTVHANVRHLENFMAEQQWDEPKFAIKAPGAEPEARIRAFVAHRTSFKIQHNTAHNCVNDYNAMMRGIAHAAAMQGHWEYDEFKQLESVRAGATQMSDHRRVNHEQKVVGRTRIGDEKCNVLGQQYLPGVVRALAGKGLLWAITMMLYMDGTFCRNVEINGPFQLSTLCLKKSTSGIVGPVSGMMLGSHTFSFKRMEKIEAFKAACVPAADWRVCPFWFLTAQLASISLLIDRALAAIIEGTVLNVGRRNAEGRVVPHEQPAWWGLQVFPQLAPGPNASSAAFGADPYRHVSLESFNRHFKAAVHSDEAGIPVHHRPYKGSSVFRKAALQRAKETGLPFAEAMAMAGWKTAATMETYYHPHIEDYRPLLTMAGYNPGDGMDPCKRYLPPMDYRLLEECLKEMPDSRALIGQHMWPCLEEAREVQQARIDQATAHGEAVHDPHALPFINLLTEARTIFLVGSCLMICEYPGLACWGLPIFQVGALQPLFSMLGHRVRATCDARAKQRAEMGRSAFEMHEQTMACFQALELKLSKGKAKSAAEQEGIPTIPAPRPPEAFPPLPAAIHSSNIVIQWPVGPHFTLQQARAIWTTPGSVGRPLRDCFNPGSAQRTDPLMELKKMADCTYAPDTRRGKNLTKGHKTLMLAMDISARQRGEAQVLQDALALLGAGVPGINTFKQLSEGCVAAYEKKPQGAALLKALQDHCLAF